FGWCFWVWLGRAAPRNREREGNVLVALARLLQRRETRGLRNEFGPGHVLFAHQILPLAAPDNGNRRIGCIGDGPLAPLLVGLRFLRCGHIRELREVPRR